MACTLGGLRNSCGRTNTPGINSLYIAIYNSAVTFSVTAGVCNGIIGASFYTYEPAPTSSDWNDAGSGAKETLSWTHIHTVNAYFPGNSAAIRNEIYLLSQSKMVVVVEDMKGDLYLLGKDNGLWATEETFNSGKKAGDGKGWTLKLDGENAEPAVTVSSIAVLGTLAS